MSLKKTRFVKGIILAPDSIALDGLEGEFKVDSTTGKIQATLKDGVNPSAAREVLTNSQTQTITNKTFDASLNTVSNIVDTNISASAAITRSKIATGTADHVIINSGTGALSSEATLAASRGGLGTSGAAFTGVVKAATGVFSASTVVNADVSATAAVARTKLASGTANRVVVNDGTGVMSDAAAITASRALASDANGIPVASAVTDTELGYVSGVTSAIQTQISGKEPSFTTLPVSKGGTNSSTALNNNRVVQSSGGAIVEAPVITAARALISDANGIPTHSAVTSTELGYVTGVTSAIQTQFSGKVNASGGTLTSGSIVTPARSDVKQDTKANLTTYAITAANGQVVFATDTKEYLAVKDGLLVSMGGTGGVANINALLTQTFDTASTADFTQTGLELVTTNMINGTQSARLIHQAGSSRSFKQTLAVDRKYRLELMQLSLQVRSSASSGNLTLLVTDETNSATIAASQSIATNSQTIASLVTNATTTVSGFSNSVINGLVVGMTVTGSGIPTGTLVSAVNTAALTITLSQAATASATVSLNFSTLPDRRTFSFTIPANCASMSYTITALQEANAPESYIDDVVIELASTALLSTSVDVPNLTAWQAYTPTFQGFGTPTNVEFEWRQVGENVEIRGKFVSGTSTAVEARVGLPAGLTSAGTGLIPSIQSCGVYFDGATTANKGGAVLIEPSVTYLTLGPSNTFNSTSTNALTKTNASASIGTNDTVSFTVSVPCAGLSATSTKTIALTQSGLVQGADSILKMYGYGGYGSTGTSVLRFTTTDRSIGSDVQYVASAVNGDSFVIQTSGYYSISANAGNGTISASRTQLALSRNQVSALTTNAVALSQTERLALMFQDAVATNAEASFVSWAGPLTAGDIIRIVADGAAQDTIYTDVTISKAGALKQVSVNTNSKITIPTSELRFEGASSRGSTATAIVRFDTQARIRGDAFTVNSDGDPAVLGTHIKMLKAGKLNVSASLLKPASNCAMQITKNQATLTAQSTTASEIMAVQQATPTTAGALNAMADFFVNIGDTIRVNLTAAPNADSGNSLNLSFQEQDIAVSVTNTLPQFSESDSFVAVNTTTARGSTYSNIPRFTNLASNIGTDITYLDSSTDGASFTAMQPGLYNISFTYESAVGAQQRIGITRNLILASKGTTAVDSLLPSDGLISMCADAPTTGDVNTQSTSVQYYLNTGDIIRGHLQTVAAPSNTAHSFFTISKVGKPNVTGVNVTPFINVPQPTFQNMYYFNSGTVAIGAVTGALTSDTANGILSYNATTGVYTALKKATVSTSFTVRSGAAANTRATITKNSATILAVGYTYLAGGYQGNAAATTTLEIGETLTFSVADNASSGATYISIVAEALSDQILTAPETFSTDTAALAYSSTYTLATLNTAPVGTYITFTYAISTNTRTQTSTRPTQTDADMNANGILIYTRAYNAASTAAQPAVIAIQIGKGLKGKSLDLYKSAGKVTQGSIDFATFGAANQQGLYYKEYEEKTGILYLDAGATQSSTITGNNFQYSDLTATTNGYLVINASKSPALTGVPLLQPRIATISDVKANGTAGGTATSGAYQTRVLNTIVDSTGIVTSLASNQFVLSAGTYYFEASAPAQVVNSHSIRIQNITDATTSILGDNAYAASANNGHTLSTVKGEVTISSSKTFELQHRVQTTAASNGFGQAKSFTENEVYSTLKITRVR